MFSVVQGPRFFATRTEISCSGEGSYPHPRAFFVTGNPIASASDGSHIICHTLLDHFSLPPFLLLSG
jgi:hypothetical protein